MAPGGLNQIPNVPRDGTRLAELGGTTEWQITAGAKFAVPSPEVRDALIGAGALQGALYTVPWGSLAQIPSAPQDGSRVKELSSGPEWQIVAGAKFPMLDAVTRNQLVRKGALEWRLNIVPDGALAALPTVPRDGTHVQELGSEAEWQVASGMKFALTDANRRASLISAGSLSSQVMVVPPGGIGSIPEGPQEGTLLQEVGGSTLFVMRCGSLYRVQDNAQLTRLVSAGLARAPILTVSGPLSEPDVTARKRCAGSGMDVCPAAGWSAANPFAPPGCKPQEAQPGE